MPLIGNISSTSSEPCLAMREAMQADTLPAMEVNEVYRLFHAIRQVNNVSLSLSTADGAQKNTGFVKNWLVHSLRTITSFWGNNAAGKYVDELPPPSAIQLHANRDTDPGRDNPELGTASGGLFSHFRDPLVFPGAAAELAYASRPEEMIAADVHFFNSDSCAGQTLLALLNDEGGNSASAEMPNLVNDKELLLAFIPHGISKRAALGQAPESIIERESESADQPQYLDQGCAIRTKTKAGTIIGDSLMVTGEYLRNPVRAVLENIKEGLLPGHPMTEAEVTMAEIGNVVQDVIFGVFTVGTYPIVKYAAAKAFTVAGHGVNGDLPCLNYEFSSEKIAELLFETDIGIVNHRPMPQRVSTKLSKAKEFKPDGLFIQEHRPTGIHTEKYMSIQRHGQEILIREKSLGEFVTYHPHAVHGERLEQRIFFDQKKQRIFFERHVPDDAGYDFFIVDGRKYIRLHGQKQELRYNWNTRHPEIKIEVEGKTEALPVYMEKLSHVWHLSERGSRPVFTTGQAKLIDRIKLTNPLEYVYRSTENLNPKAYGRGKIYEARLPGRFMSEAPVLRAVEMNGELLPVRLRVTPGHGVRYAVYNTALPGKADHPIEWDGARWILEKATSRHVAKSLKNAVKRDMHDKVSAEHLSAPDDHGIRWDSKGKGYLKIKNGFVQLHPHRYHPDAFFVRQGSRSIHVVLKNHQFHLETLAQRLQKLRTIGLSGRSPGQAEQASVMRKRTAADILADAYNTNARGVQKILREYRFPAYGVFDEMEFALHIEAYQSVPPWAKRFKLSPLEQPSVANPRIELGQEISGGAYGTVYEDLASDHFLIKEYKNRFRQKNKARQRAIAKDEADLFVKYYGPESASVIEHSGKIYLRMYKVPGMEITKIRQPILPEDACERYVDMLERMLDVGIIHKDLHTDNFLYDMTSEQFYPIDFSNLKESFFSSNVNVKENVNAFDERQWQHIMRTIRSVKKASAEELAALNQIPFTESERELVKMGLWLDDIVRVRELGGLSVHEKYLIQDGKTLDDIARLRENKAPSAQNRPKPSVSG